MDRNDDETIMLNAQKLGSDGVTKHLAPGPTPVDHARNLANQARAVKKPVLKHMELHHLITKQSAIGQPHSFAPVAKSAGSKTVSPGQKSADDWSNPTVVRAALRTHREAWQARRLAGSYAAGGFVAGRLSANAKAAGSVAPLGASEHAANVQLVSFQTAGAGLIPASAMVRQQMPSIAPRGAAAKLVAGLQKNFRAAPHPDHSAAEKLHKEMTAESLRPRAVTPLQRDGEVATFDLKAASAQLQRQQIADAVRDILNAEARRPPSTGTAFDATLTPQYSAYKTIG